MGRKSGGSVRSTRPARDSTERRSIPAPWSDFSRDPQTGALTFIEAHVGLVTPSVLLADPGEPALSPDEKHLYVPDGGQTVIFGVTVPEPSAAALAASAGADLFAVHRRRATS